MSPAWPFPKTWRALVRPRRVEILRTLRERPHTPTELSKRLSVSGSTIRDDLRVLSEAGLVLRREEERVWAYHELTPTGRSVADAGPLVPALASAALFFAAAGAGLFFWSRQPKPSPFGSIPAPAADPLVPWVVAVAIACAIAGLLLLLVALALRRGRGPAEGFRTGSGSS